MKEGIYVLSNICTTGTVDQKAYLLSLDVLELLVKLFSDREERLQSVLTEAIDDLLKVSDHAKDSFVACGGVELLHKYQVQTTAYFWIYTD